MILLEIVIKCILLFYSVLIIFVCLLLLVSIIFVVLALLYSFMILFAYAVGTTIISITYKVLYKMGLKNKTVKGISISGLKGVCNNCNNHYGELKEIHDKDSKVVGLNCPACNKEIYTIITIVDDTCFRSENIENIKKLVGKMKKEYKL